MIDEKKEEKTENVTDTVRLLQSLLTAFPSPELKQTDTNALQTQKSA